MNSPPALAFAGVHHADEFAAAARASTRLHRPWVHPPTEKKAAADFLRRRAGPSDFGFMIHEYESGALAGFIEVTNVVRGSFQSAYLGYYMFRGFEGRGYMTWALDTIIKRVWSHLKLHRLEANIQPGNVASIGLVRKLGFAKEGYSPRYLKIGGRWRDHERWAILRERHAA